MVGDKAVFYTAPKFILNSCDKHNTGNGRCDCDFSWSHKSHRQPTQICKRLVRHLKVSLLLQGGKFKKHRPSATSLWLQTFIHSFLVCCTEKMICLYLVDQSSNLFIILQIILTISNKYVNACKHPTALDDSACKWLSWTLQERKVRM